MSPAPIATYRLQLNEQFTFSDAENIVNYLALLGVSHLYLSPCLETVEHSAHGYDTVDYSEVDSALGGREAFERLCATAKRAGLGIILDTVPNHMAIAGRKNKWWWDVLRCGAASKYAQYFDIDWSFDENGNLNKLVVPILGDRYGHVLSNGDIQLVNIDQEIFVKYGNSEFPLSKPSVALIDDIAAINANDNRLHEILEQQHYRLAYWGLANEEHDYRRFFDITSLIALRQDRREVFDATNQLPLQFVANGHIDGLRVDHVDGLSNPAQYIDWLHEAAGTALIYVEKILRPDERLRPTWPVDGTTGYDTMRLVDGLFIDPTGSDTLESFFRQFTGYEYSWADTVTSCKLEILNESFAGDVALLCDQLVEAFANHISARDYSLREIRRVVITLVSRLPVYRTYVVSETSYVTQDDVANIEQAVLSTKNGLPDEIHELVDLVASVLTLAITGPREAEFVRRFQQLTGPTMAKGVEDRAFYRYNVLTALNEVGGSPDHFGVRPDEFHERCSEMARLWPNTMTASTTHDTKRSEDHRHRIALLSEIPEDWSATVKEWDALCVRYISDSNAPDNETRYLLYQTLVGAWPIDIDRIRQYMTKATREASLLTSWKNPNNEFETSLRAFIAEIYADAGFMRSLQTFVEKLTQPARLNSLAATVLKLTMPGLPDIYQGTEFWAHHLVDPDNRQPVDYTMRRKLLAETTSFDNVPPTDDSGAAKQFVITRLLHLRRRFTTDATPNETLYRPIICKGERSANVVAFARSEVIVVVPRLVMSLDNDWLDTAIDLPQGTWRDVFTGATYESQNLPLSSLFDQFPVSVLNRI